MDFTAHSFPLAQLRFWSHQHNGSDDNSNYANIGLSSAALLLGPSTLTTATVNAIITKGQQLITLPRTDYVLVSGKNWDCV